MQFTIHPDFYRPTREDVWQGRIDGIEPDVQRWHQRIVRIDALKQTLPVLKSGEKGIALIGFACDEGVRRNRGRVGAAQGPLAFRKASSSLPVHIDEQVVMIDMGDVLCSHNDMEQAQQSLALMVQTALAAGYHPLVIGGGHEVAYGHYSGIRNFVEKNQRIGIINFDAHFDLRQPDDNGNSSGTGFWQIAQDCIQNRQDFLYLPIGIQQNGNTRRLFETAASLGVQYVSAEAFSSAGQQELLKAVQEFIDKVDHIYLTVCLDVFVAAFAPGVSATAYSGILPDSIFFSCFDAILKSGKVISMDMAELNPELDIDQRTAKLAAALAFRAVSLLGT